MLVLLCHCLGHRNVYVAVHMPYSHSKHRSHSRHKRKHRHGNGHGHHGNDSSRDSHGDGNDVSREGAELPEDVTVDTAADTTPHRRRVSLDMRSMSVVQQEDIELEGWSHHRFNKSHSLPTGSSIEHNLTIPSKLGTFIGSWGCVFYPSLPPLPSPPSRAYHTLRSLRPCEVHPGG